MAANILFTYNSNAIHGFSKKNDHRSSCPRSFLGDKRQILAKLTRRTMKQNFNCFQTNEKPYNFTVYAVTKGSAEPSKSEETMPSWAKPDSDEPPPWAREDGKKAASEGGFEAPFFVYLLASAVAAIAAIGSIFEYANQKPVFGVVYPESIFYAPLLGFFTFGGLPTSAFLWFKSVQVANKEAEEQDKRDGYL